LDDTCTDVFLFVVIGYPQFNYGRLGRCGCLISIIDISYLGNSYSRLARHQEVYMFPSSRLLTPGDITRLTQGIKECHRMKLLKLRAARVSRDELCAVDSTSRSAYGSSLADIRWGHNKEGMPLEQTDEVVVYTLKQHMPIYYRMFPGNIPDSRTMDVITTDIDHAEFPDVIFITDRGYMSNKVLEDFILKDRRAIMAVKVSQKIPLEKIRAFGQFGAKPDEMEFDAENKVYYKQYGIDYEVKTQTGTKKADRLKLNLFFDPTVRGEKVMSTEMKLQGQMKALTEIRAAGEPAPEARISVRSTTCSKWKWTPMAGLSPLHPTTTSSTRPSSQQGSLPA